MTQRYGFAEFGETMLGAKFYAKQKELLDQVKLGCYVVGLFNNGGGKTSKVLPTIILGALSMLRARVFSTAGAFRQIKDQLNPALHAYAQRFPSYQFQDCRINTRDANSFWHGFATSEAARFEGQHGDQSHPLVLIVDEAKTVKDPVFGAVDRCRMPRQHCIIVVVSSAGYAGGEFHALNTGKRSALTYPPVVQTSHDCPHISKEEIEADERKWGKEHPLVKSMHYSEFMGFVQGSIVQIYALDQLLASPPTYEPGEKKAYCDPAWSESASGDESTLAVRDGNRITLPLCFRERGLHATAARYAAEFGRLGLKSWQIEMEADGEGEQIIRTLHAMGWPILRALAGGPPRKSELYKNLATENWVEGAMDILNRKWILPDDQDLYAQMINRKYVPGNRGVCCIESKQAMKDPNREGGAVPCSPDRADALFGCMAPLPINRPMPVLNSGRERNQDDDKGSWSRDDIWQPEERSNGIPGTWAG